MTQNSHQELIRQPFLHYLKAHKRSVLLGLTFLLFTNSLDALPPLLIGRTIDLIAGGGPGLMGSLALLLGVSIVLMGCRFLWRIFWGGFHHRVAEDLRNQIFGRFTLLEIGFFRKRMVGETLALIINDVNSFRMAIGPGLLLFFDGIFVILVVAPIMVSISLTWTLKTLILMPLLPFVIARVMKAVHENYRVQQSDFAELSGRVQEMIAGIRVIKGFAQEKNQLSQFDVVSRKFERSCNRVALSDSCFGPAMEFAVTIGCFILLLFGAPEVLAGQVTLGGFFAFYQYIDRMAWPMTAIGISLSHVQQGRASFTRIKELLTTPPEDEPQHPKPWTPLEKIELRNLSFTYPGETSIALNDLSLQVFRSQTLGVVGPTGSGKTTLADLFCRLYNPPPNSLLINDTDVRDFPLQLLRQKITYVAQDPFLFNTTIRENLTSGELISDSELLDILNLVQFTEKEAFPQGLETRVGENGVALSGGQKQRLALARALLRSSELLILDDTLSAVDAETEAQIVGHLKAWLKKQKERSLTVIIMSHRLSSVREADRILVLQAGRPQAQGTHLELLEASAIYRTLYDLQKERVESELVL